jgi:hypothetical protein
MNKIELDLFAVPFAVMTLGENSRSMNKQLIADLEYEKEHNNAAPKRTGVHVWQSNFAMETRYESFQKLKNIFMQYAEPTLRKAGFTGDLNSYMSIEDFWGNINDNPFAFHTPHFHGHGLTVFSGIYYPSSGVQNGASISDSQNLDEIAELKASSIPSPGDIVFMDPALNIKRQVYPLGEKLNRYPYYGLEICLTPKEGTLVFFPHYVSHYVVPTEKENFKRYSIPFSINLKT